MSDRARLGRELLEARSFGALATQSVRHAGTPFASVVEYAVEELGEPVFLLSNLAVHTKNLRADSRASLLVFDRGAEQDPLGSARVTLLGHVEVVREEEIAATRERYLARHPGAAQWAGFGDFRFYRLRVEEVYYVGGFGAMGWISAQDFRAEAGQTAG